MPQAPALRDNSESSTVARLVTLHHRRRGWAWVTAGSLIGLAVYVLIDVNLFAHLTGAAAALGIIPVFVLLALLLVGVVDVIVDTSRLHRADAAVRASAKDSISHYPWYAHAHRWPPRHPGSWVAAIFMLAVMTCVTAYILPQEVNAWAYVTGAEHQDIFNPVSYSTACAAVGRRGLGQCQTVTQGYLSSSGASVYWSPQVPLGKPFTVRDPLWAWGTGRGLIDDDGSAVGTIAGGLFFDAVALLLLYVVVVLLSGTSPRQRQQASLASGAAPPPHHQSGDHHGGGGRRRSHHGRRKR
jgi:hypothetical protein